MLKRLLAEPLVHFVLLALAIYAVYSVVNPPDMRRADEIVVTQARIGQIVEVFARAWQRPPTLEELRGLIDDHVREEVYVREARLLGLDRDDTVIRRRLRQKMEFMSDAEADEPSPTDAELEAFLAANRAGFEIDAMYSFEQVYLSPSRRGDRIDQDAADLLAILRRDATTDAVELGDITLLPHELATTSTSSIAAQFGPDFAAALSELTPGQWDGPVRSTFGLHLVRVTARQSGREPTLGEVREAVARAWDSERRRARQEERFKELLKRYEVRIEGPAAAAK